MLFKVCVSLFVFWMICPLMCYCHFPFSYFGCIWLMYWDALTVGVSVQFSSVAQSFPTLCGPMNCSMPGLPVHHQLPEFTETHVHWVSDAIQPSHPVSSPSPPAPNPSQHQSLFQWVNSLHEVAKVHILLKPGLENFEHYFTSMWDDCNCAVVWAFFGIAFLWYWNENWHFPVLWPLLSFPNLLAYWVQHFHSIIFQDLK